MKEFKKNYIEQTEPKINFNNIVLLKFFKVLPLSVTPGNKNLLNLGV